MVSAILMSISETNKNKPNVVIGGYLDIFGEDFSDLSLGQKIQLSFGKHLFKIKIEKKTRNSDNTK